MKTISFITKEDEKARSAWRQDSKMNSIESAIERLRTQFVDEPANFTVEAEMAFRLKKILNDDGPLERATLNDNSEHDSGSSQGDCRDHSEFSEAILDTENIDRVHCEVTLFTDQDENSLEKIDLVVFQEEVTLNLNNGTKRFDIDSVDAAIELKYIKNKKYLRASSKLYGRIEKDINRLKALPSRIERHVLVFSNFDLRRKQERKDPWIELDNSSEVELYYTHPFSEI